ncbi:MAG: NAD(+)/NADH kinase, partial [Rhodobacteraceae bacterium]|nr:NAD(+)/NADH kinase [Paracoccaceae bacterium]
MAVTAGLASLAPSVINAAKGSGAGVAGQRRITFLASEAEAAQEALARLTARYGSAPEVEAEMIVALGGDGFMLQTLHAMEARNIAVYGMNCGTIGFLMNEYDEEGLFVRLAE